MRRWVVLLALLLTGCGGGAFSHAASGPPTDTPAAATLAPTATTVYRLLPTVGVTPTVNRAPTYARRLGGAPAGAASSVSAPTNVGPLPRGTAASVSSAAAAPQTTVRGQVGQRVSAGTLAVTLNALADPATSPAASAPKPGNRLAAADISVTNMGAAPTSYSPTAVTVTDTDGRQYGASGGGGDPPLPAGTSAPGATARGWVAFEVPAGAKLMTLTYTTSGAAVTFDLSGRG